MKAEDVFALGSGWQHRRTCWGNLLILKRTLFTCISKSGLSEALCILARSVASRVRLTILGDDLRHLNFFQRYCFLKARVSRIVCEEHGIYRAEAPWNRKGSGFTLLFEQVVMSLVRKMPVTAVARHVGIMDNRIWRIIRHYVTQAINALDLSGFCGLALDETASTRGHNYVTIFLDMDREERPVIFAVPGKGKNVCGNSHVFSRNTVETLIPSLKWFVTCPQPS